MSKDSENTSLRDKFIDEITTGIISGKYPIGEKLPPEREMAKSMGISRTVIHSGLSALAADGLVELKERQGCVVVDYRINGKMPLIDAIALSEGDMAQSVLRDFLQARVLIESETAKLAAKNRSNDDLYQLFTILRQIGDTPDDDSAALAELVFRFHKWVTVASGNTFYTLCYNSMEKTITKLYREMYCLKMKKSDIQRQHEDLYEAILERMPDKAVDEVYNVVNHKLT